MIAKAIEVSIPNTYITKIRLHRGAYEWKYSGVIIRNDGLTMLYRLVKIIKPDTRIGVSNLKR